MLTLENLLQQNCQAFKQGTAAMIIPTIESHLSILSGWQATFDYKGIEKKIQLKNHYQVMAFLNALAYIAHQQDHHPQVTYDYNHVHILFTTHTCKGVSTNDMIMAAHVNQLLQEK